MFYLMGHCKKYDCKHKHIQIEDLIQNIFGRRKLKQNDTVVVGYLSYIEWQRLLEKFNKDCFLSSYSPSKYQY